MRARFGAGLTGVIAGCALVTMAPAASALTIGEGGTYNVNTGGIVTGFVCQFGFQCAGGSGDFAYEAPPVAGFDAATGTITINDEGMTLDLDLVVANATFVATAGALNGVDEIQFSNVSYSGTDLSFTEQGSQILIGAGQSINISGNYAQFLGNTTVQGPDGFSTSAAVSGGLCWLGDSLVCSFDFGPGGPTSLGIGAAGSQVTRKFLHGLTVDPAPVPEPGTALLVGLGLLATIAAARRAG